MAAVIKTTVSIQKNLYAEAEVMAQQLNVSRDHFFDMAIENFIKNNRHQAMIDALKKDGDDQFNPDEEAETSCQRSKTGTQSGGERTTIDQGDLYWVQLEESGGSQAGPAHPYVVMQDNVFNHSRINTLVVCALTSNLKQAKAPGNVLLEAGEANLPRQSVVVVSKISIVNKVQLGEYIGSLSGERISQILAGMQFLQLLTAHPVTGEDNQ